MIESSDQQSIQMLRRAVSRAFPDRIDFARSEPETDLVRFWADCSRALQLSPSELATRLAGEIGMTPSGPLEHSQVSPEALAMLPLSFCQMHKILPIRLDGENLIVASCNPGNDNTLERIRFLSGRQPRCLFADPASIDEALFVAYSAEAERVARKASEKPEDEAENSIVRLARALLENAISQRASDLHIQSFMGAHVVRIRVDGLLRRVNMLPDAVATTLVRHIKARCGMDTSNALMPQDGRMSIVLGEKDYDIRVSTLPANRGERLVMRILDQGRVHRLSHAGFSLAALQTLRRVVSLPSGMVILTGPTGSGKTSTLYSLLSEINHVSRNIITVENPVEYRMAGLSQVEVNDKAGRGFASVLRSILRQDPDVILIGEIRDAETAEIASQAALTGHLVLTTLHTSDALTTIPRLFNLGVTPSVVADSLIAVAAQRLCRKLCMYCRQAVTEPLTPEEDLFRQITRNSPTYRASGCQACDYTGFHGRLPIIEIMEMNASLRDAVAGGESRTGALAALREGGLQSLAASGSLQIISGHTTVREVLQVVGPGFWQEISRHYGHYYSTDFADSIPVNAAQGMALLLMSEDRALGDELEAGLKQCGFRLVRAQNADGARAALRYDEDIAFIIGDVPDTADLDEAARLLSHNRASISWARLPAVVLLPAPLATQQEALRNSGVMAAFMSKPLNVENLLQHIRRTQAR